ncbi:MAG: rhomboid family intramembrane serine protease [Bacteroidales bacterium]|nr:rhomboid family intramembrane serine protease [Bacteroidales bacterium]
MRKIGVSLGIVALMWIIFGFGLLFPGNINSYGILPRSSEGLMGIVCAPFLHGSLDHIMSNSLPVFVLTLVLLIFYENLAFRVWTLSTLLGGLLIWIFARGESYHIGASGVIFSLLGFLLASGIFRRSFKSLLIAIPVFLLYGGVMWGIFPNNPDVSWEAHLFGLIAGVILAYCYRNTPSDGFRGQRNHDDDFMR